MPNIKNTTPLKQYREGKDYSQKPAKKIRAEIKKKTPLLTFNFQEQSRGEHWVTISTEEYTSICPFSNWPDFGRVEISYVPNKKCLELKSFKLYINAFRNIKIFHETALEVIFADFLEVVNPKKAVIKVDMNVRGNVKTVCKKYFKTSQS